MATSATGTLGRLRALNLGVGFAHLVQGLLILALANDFATPVTGSFLAGPPGDGPGELDRLFDVRFGPLVAAFLFLAAVDHLLMATPPVRGWYERELGRGRNMARWVEYSVSASLMVVLIAMLTGISDVAALLALFGVNASMILFGLLMERQPAGPGASWAPFWFGCIAGAVPWIAIAVYLAGGDGTPGFVIGIFVSLFVLFNSFAVNMALHYRRVGAWGDPLVAETAYVWLSLAAKSALAWQVFAGTLAA
jgi:Heliorhodopsin